MDLSLLVLQGKPQGKEVPVQVSPFLIGRDPECHIRPNSDMVSRLHCSLTIVGEQVRIRDLGSTNGTIVDGERLTEELPLSDGDIFQVGPLIFQVVIRAVAAGPSPAAAPRATSDAGPQPQVAPARATSAEADDVVQWLVGDSKNEIPSSGSGVYAGDTVFTTGPLENNTTAHATSGVDHAEQKGDDKKQKARDTSGGAAHAAEDVIRRFLERRPHKP